MNDNSEIKEVINLCNIIDKNYIIYKGKKYYVYDIYFVHGEYYNNIISINLRTVCDNKYTTLHLNYNELQCIKLVSK